MEKDRERAKEVNRGGNKPLALRYIRRVKIMEKELASWLELCARACAFVCAVVYLLYFIYTSSSILNQIATDQSMNCL